MGYRIIFLILAFLIIIGSITMVLGRKQIDSKSELTSKLSQKQVQLLANSTAQEGIRIVKQFRGNHPAEQSYTDRVVGNSTISMQIFDNIYNSQALPMGTYLVLANVATRASDGVIYRAQTEAMYSYFTPNNPPVYDISNLLTDPTTGRYFVIFRETDILVFRANAEYYSIPTLMGTASYMNIIATIPMNILAGYNNTIYINKNLGRSITIGCAAQINASPEDITETSGYFPIDYKATIIVNTGSPTRIGSHLFSRNPDRITIQSTSAITTNHIQPIRSNAYFYSQSTIARPQTTADTPSGATRWYVEDFDGQRYDGYPTALGGTPPLWRPIGNDTPERQHLSQVPIISAAGIHQNQPLPVGEVPFPPITSDDSMKSWAETSLPSGE